MLDCAYAVLVMLLLLYPFARPRMSVANCSRSDDTADPEGNAYHESFFRDMKVRRIEHPGTRSIDRTRPNNN